MDVDQIVTKSLGYPRKSLGKVAILGGIVILALILFFVLVFIGALTNNPAIITLMVILGMILALVVGFFYYGYIYRVITATIAGSDDLPNFDDFGDMIVGGIKVIVVNIVYGLIFGIIAMIPVIIVALVLTLFGALTMPTAMTDPTALIGSGLVFWLFYLLGFLLYLVLIALGILYLIVVPMAIANMAYNGKLGSAFAIGDLRSKIEDIRWGKAVVWVLANYFVFIIAILVSYILGLLFIGILLVPLLVIPFISVYYARSTGLLYLNK